MKHIPLGDKIIIEESKGETKSSGGIILPSQSKSHSVGKVVAVGPGLFTQTGILIPMTVKINDNVMYQTGIGTEIKLDNKKFRMFRESDLDLILSD